ncbi:hypothetical protein [Campylobacter showae]|uniref:hypothetical protein n=1 Tax=Campylobacter showae TaxID=204 RepID=UPI0028D8DD46|nr:hypothetical protein [Campylobacter showae]
MGFLNIKFLASVGVALLIALGGAGLEIWRLNGALSSAKAETQDAKDKLEKEQTKLALKEAANQIYAANVSECNMRIDLQNAKFEALEAKKQDAIKEAKQAKARFEKLAAPAKDAQCQEKLKFYEDAASVAAKAFKGLR